MQVNNKPSTFSLVVVTPLFNDWQCIPILAHELKCLHSPAVSISLLIIDDGSLSPHALGQSDFPSEIQSVEIIHLGCNLGHQRAIAIGVCEVVRRGRYEALILIDSDGEDSPLDAQRLLNELAHHPNAVVVARRRKRSEPRYFRLSYRIYKQLFASLIGTDLDFGNFSAMRLHSAKRLSFMPDLWNHFAATVVKSKLSIVRVSVDRRLRSHGQTKMNFVSLVNHGLGAIATFSDFVFVRLLIISGLATICFGLIGIGIIIIRFTTVLAIPGWATIGLGFTFIGVLQVLVMLTVVTFLGLSSRSSISAPPRTAFVNYISSTTLIR